MQNRAISDAYRIEYAPFEDLFRDQPRLIHWAVNQPLPGAIQDLHHHDALEVGYCREGAGIFIIDGEVLPFSAPCATVIYPGPVSYTHLDVYKRQVYTGTVSYLVPLRAAHTSRNRGSPMEPGSLVRSRTVMASTLEGMAASRCLTEKGRYSRTLMRPTFSPAALR